MDKQQTHVATIDHDGRRYNVTVVTQFDGIEYVGRLWFADESWDDVGTPDRGAIPGRTKEEVDQVIVVYNHFESPLVQRFLHRLADFARVILVDRRGLGMSDPAPEDVPLEALLGFGLGTFPIIHPQYQSYYSPLWLNEGLAEYFQTFRIVDDKGRTAASAARVRRTRGARDGSLRSIYLSDWV